MSTKHTPGPWTIPHFAVDDVSCNCVFVLGGGYAGSICDVSVDNGIPSIAHGGNDAPPLEEAKANARLIAAAPELLEALEFVKSTLPHIGGSERSVQSLLQTIDAAIAKSTGK